MSNFTFVFFSLVVSSPELICVFLAHFFFCAVIAFHCPCHLVDLYLFIVICIVFSIVAAVLNLVAMTKRSRSGRFPVRSGAPVCSLGRDFWMGGHSEQGHSAMV